MIYAEIAASFIIGLLLILLLVWVFSIKSKGLTRALLNTLAGAFVLIALSLFNVAALPLNPLNALLTGFLGVFGLVVVYVITVYL
jgi:hypothetical protein